MQKWKYMTWKWKWKYSKYEKSKNEFHTHIYLKKWQEGNNKKICNPVQNVLRKIKNSSKVRQNRKTFMSIVEYFLSTSAKNLFSQGRLGTRLLFRALLQWMKIILKLYKIPKCCERNSRLHSEEVYLYLPITASYSVYKSFTNLLPE